MKKPTKIEAKIEALNQKFEHELKERREILRLVAEYYAEWDRAAAVPKRSWWAFWRPNPQVPAWQKVEEVFQKLNDATRRQAGLFVVTTWNDELDPSQWVHVSARLDTTP